MSSFPTNYSTYGKYVDLQVFTGSAAPATSGSLWMSGALGYTAGDEILYTNIGMDVDGTFDASGQITTDGLLSGSSLALRGGGVMTAVADEDNMASNSATKLATQQSIKAYVDAQVTAQDLDFQGDSGGALSIDLDSEVLDIAGGTGIDTAGSSNTLTVAIDSTVATLTGTQTLTNKTLTSPDVNTPDIDGGTMDGTTLGASSAVTITDADMNGGSIDGVAIGAASQSSGEFTTMSGSSTLDVEGIARFGQSALTVSAAGVLSGSATATLENATLNYITIASQAAIETATFGASDQLTVSAAGVLSGSATATFANATLDQITVGSVDLNGGAIDGANVTVGASKTLDVSAGTFTTSVAQNLAKLTSGIANNDGDQDFGSHDLKAETLTSDVSTGTAPLVVASTTNVANLNASSLNGATMASPGAIGGTSAAAGTFAALVGTSLSVSDGNITNVGVLEADTIQSDADAAGLNINFDGNTGTNKLSLTDNLASALDITQGANSYIKFDSTDGDEALSFGTTPIVEFLSTGGSTGDADFSVSGYAQFAGIVEVDGALDCDSTSTFAGLATLAAGATLSGGDLTVTSGDITCSSTSSEVKAGSFVTYSDAALKTNVETVDNAMDMIQGLRGVSYDLKANGTREYGFIAQEVNEILPEVVSTSGDLMGIDYTRITSLLVEAVKTQQAEIIALQEKLDK